MQMPLGVNSIAGARLLTEKGPDVALPTSAVADSTQIQNLVSTPCWRASDPSTALDLNRTLLPTRT